MGMLGSDDVLACFIAGNVFTWDDWFRLETQDDSLQPTIDMLLNVSIFMWYGAVCPWHLFVTSPVIPIYRLIPLGIMVLLFRRLPMVLAYHWLGWIHQIENIRHAFFMGVFGPIGVSAIFYLYISREFLRDMLDRPDVRTTTEAIEVVVWFLCICSVTVHGLCVPLGKLGLYLPRTFSTAISTERLSASQSRVRDETEGRTTLPNPSQSTNVRGVQQDSNSDEPVFSAPKSLAWIPRAIARAASHIMNDIRRPHGAHSHAARDSTEEKQDESDVVGNGNVRPGITISAPTDARPIGREIPERPSSDETGGFELRQMEEGGTLQASKLPQSDPSSAPGSGANTPRSGRQYRAIQFADERTTSRANSGDAGP